MTSPAGPTSLPGDPAGAHPVVGTLPERPGRERQRGIAPGRWLAGKPYDWGFSALGCALIAAGFYSAWINRHLPVRTWEHAPAQVAWLAVTIYQAAAGILAWRRDRSLQSVIRDGYGLAAAGTVIFLAGILLTSWWSSAFGPDFGVAAVFRPTNLLQIAGAGLIVTGPLRAAVTRGELVAGPTAVISAVLLLATFTFLTQFDHPYVDRYAASPPPPPSRFDPYDYKEEILGALGLLIQTAGVTGVILWTLRQIRLPAGSITLMLVTSALLTATQLGHFSMLLVAGVVGVLSEIALRLARPRADRVLTLRLFAVSVGALLSGVYLVDIALERGTWWSPDMTYGVALASALVGAMISYVVFPGPDAVRAASVLWPALTQETSREAPDVTVERVEHALKVLASTRDLAESPLVGLRCLPAPTPAGLRKVIVEAIEYLRTSSFQLDAQAGQILDLYYVRRIGGHYAVTVRVGLSRAAYFNRRSYGVRRLVDRLRELEEPAASA